RVSVLRGDPHGLGNTDRRPIPHPPCPRPAGGERGRGLLGPVLLRVPHDRRYADRRRPAYVGAMGHPRRPVSVPERDPERHSDPGRGAHGRGPGRVLPVPRTVQDGSRGRNLETGRVGWSGFTVTSPIPDETPFARLAELTTKREATPKRLEKRALLAAFLKSLRRDEVPPAVHLIVGRIFAESDSRALNVGWATLKKALAGTKQATLVPRPLTILEATRMFAQIAEARGPDSTRARRRLLAPMKPMLAEMSGDLDEVLAEHGGQTAVEYKLDGARIQIHRKGDVVRIFSRRLSDVTDSLPEIVAIAKSLPASEFLLEGEVVAVNADGKPLPFQDLMRRFRRVHGIAAAQEEIPLKLYLFDLLHVDGQTLIDAPYRARWESLERLVPSEYLTARRIVTHYQEIEPFLQDASAPGHEGLMAKALDSTYSVGKRGKKWFKIKPADLLDMAIVAAEWGSGRREGWLSNYWLAVRDESTGGFQMIGKTFKGLTDAEFETMTERLRGLATSEERWGFHVRPEVVVEVAYNEIQR